MVARFAKNRISEHTYYDNKKILRDINYPYEIFGAYIDTVQENKVHPHLRRYRVSDIFEKSQRWSHKKGLWLYPREDNVTAVAKSLFEYRKAVPERKPSSK